jgi:hypothetical protein
LLQDLASTLQQGRETADNAARSLAGEQVEQPMGLGGADMGSDLGMGGDMGAPAPGGEMSDLDVGGDFAATDAAAGGSAELGRSRRDMAESRARRLRAGTRRI